MTARLLARDEQIKLARAYQLSVLRMMLRLEEDLIKGTFTGDMRKVMRDFKLCISDAAHDASLATLTTKEENESIAALEKQAEAYLTQEKEPTLVHINIFKQKGI